MTAVPSILRSRGFAGLLTILTLAFALPLAACDGCKDNPAGPDAPLDAGTDAPGPVEVVCAEIPALPSGVCQVTAGDDRKLLIGNVLAPNTAFKGGQVAVDTTGTITCVGCDCAQGGETVITCPAGVISPGLINTHDHITFAQNSPYQDSGERYEQRHDWRSAKRGHTKISTKPGTITLPELRWGELRFLFGGATSTVGSGGTAGLLRNLDRANLLEGLAIKPVHYQTFPLDDNSNNIIRTGDCNYGPAPDTAASIAGDDAYEPHVSEGIDEQSRNEFLCLSSDTYDTTAPGVSTNVAIAKTAMIHGIGLTPSELGTMAAAGTALIWSPRSNVTLYGDTAQVTTAARMGVEIALGTDWMPTGSMNMLRELHCADTLNQNYYNKFFSDRDLWRMATANAASVTASSDKIGSLAIGRVADIAIFDGKVNTSYRAILAGEPKDVALVMRGGKVMYGDASTVAAVPGTTGCDAVDVCGVAKQACLGELSTTYAALKAAVGTTAYPDFNCGEPDNEPSCTPTRPASVDGSTIYTGDSSATDSDGDGIANTADNCPTTFNPIRPVDKGKQGNADNDAEGDACDPCPVDPNTPSCTAVNPNDADRDGIDNAVDNCPGVANPTQLDTDTDGKGDLCDACPMAANPGAAGCSASIYDIKAGTVPQGSAVRVSNALVTGKGSNGFYIQVKVGDMGYNGPDNSGLFVFAGAMSPFLNDANVGTRVNIDATVGAFQGALQLASVTAVTVASATVEAPPAPISATLAEIKTGGTRAAKLDAVIVATPMSSVTAIDTMFGEFTVTAGADALQVDDFLFVTTPTPTVGKNFTSITGILHNRQMLSKLEPRNAGDLVGGAVTLLTMGPATSFIRVGQMMSPTTPTPLTITLSGPAPTNTFVAITSSNATALTVSGGGITIPMGQSSGQVLVTGLVQNAAVTLTATLNSSMLTATVRVLGAAEVPTMVSMTPPAANVNQGGMTTFTIELNLPAPVGGTSVAVALTPANAGTVPATVTVAAGQTQATFTYTDGSLVTAATVSATLLASTATSTITVSAGANHLVINELDYDQIGTDSAEFIEIKNPTGMAISLAGVAVVLINGSGNAEYKRYDLSSVGSLAAGKYLVLAKAGFAVGVDATLLTPAGWLANDNAQNGAPDGIALINVTNKTVIDALSYEGGITAAVITGFVGTTNLVEGGTALDVLIADSNTIVGSLCRKPDGSDTDNANADWKFCAAPTSGAPN